ncbi:DUF669 domain-containing protein [Enterococcus sp. LJL128]
MTEKQFDWAKFDKTVDLDALQADVKTAEENGGGDFPTIPDDQYEVKVRNMELGHSKAGDPMVKIQFEILEGEFAGNLVFYNGVMQPHNEKAFGYQVHKNNEILRALYDADDDEVKFDNFKDYSDLILDIAEEIIEDEWNYILEQRRAKNPEFAEFEIIEILD